MADDPDTLVRLVDPAFQAAVSGRTVLTEGLDGAENICEHDRDHN